MMLDQVIQSAVGGLAIGCIYSLVALGISMIMRATDIQQFAQGELLMIGAFAGGWPAAASSPQQSSWPPTVRCVGAGCR